MSQIAIFPAVISQASAIQLCWVRKAKGMEQQQQQQKSQMIQPQYRVNQQREKKKNVGKENLCGVLNKSAFQ